jgi:hypothetical protein
LRAHEGLGAADHTRWHVAPTSIEVRCRICDDGSTPTCHDGGL